MNSTNNRAITYNRGSTDLQEASIPGQKKVAEKYAQDNKLEIIRHFDDDGWSGRNAEERPAFMEMMEYVRTHNDFKYILVYDVSRWGRFENPKEATYWEVMCEKAGKKIKYTSEGYVNDDSMGAFITKVVKDSEASEYSKKLSKVSFRGHRHYAELGFHVGGGKKYGYNRLLLDENGKPVKVLADGEHKATKLQRVKFVKGDPEQVKTVQRIYSMYVSEGHGIGNICNILNSEGIPSPRNKGWSKSTVWTILHDETYIGCLVYNRYVCNNFHEKGNGWIKYKPESEWIIKKGAHDSIIEEAVFKAVQAKTRQAYKGGFKFKGKGRGYHTPYLLSGIMKCVECNGNYQGRVAISKTKKKTYETRYYLCGNYAMKDSCKKWNVPKDVVEAFAVKQISKRLRDPLWVQAIKERLEKKINVIKKDRSKDIEKIEAELRDVQNRIANIVRAIEEGSDKDILGDRLNELKAKRDRLSNMKAQCSREIGVEADPTETVNHILSQLKTFEKEFPNAEIPTKKVWLSKFIYEIRVDPTEKKCYYYIKIVPGFQNGAGEETALVKFGANSHHQLDSRYFEGAKFGVNPHHQLYSSIFNSCDVKDLCEVEVLDLSKRTAYKSKEEPVNV